MRKVERYTVRMIEDVLNVLAEGFIQVWPDEDITETLPDEDITETWRAAFANREAKVQAMNRLNGKRVKVNVTSDGVFTVVGTLSATQERTDNFKSPYYWDYTYVVTMGSRVTTTFTVDEIVEIYVDDHEGIIMLRDEEDCDGTEK